MSNGDDQQQYNCALEICCGGDDNAKQRKAISELVRHRLGVPHQEPSFHDTIKTMIALFDFAPKGSLVQFKNDVSTLARGNPYVG